MNKWVIVLIGVMIVFSANLFFVTPIVFSDDNYNLTLHPAKTDQHRALYFIPVDEFKDTGSISKDVCIYEQRSAPYPRVHIGYALYGIIHSIVKNPFYSHFIGNVVFMSITLLIIVLLFSRELRPVYGLIYGAIFWGPLYDILILKQYALAVFHFVATGTTTYLYSSLIHVYGFTTKITVARVFVYLFILLFAYVYLSALSRRMKMFFLSILLGISIYIHLFSAMIAYTTMGIICVYYMFKKNEEWKDTAIAIFSSLIMIIPFAIHAMRITSIYDCLETAYRYGSSTSHQFFLQSAFFSIILILCMAILYKSKRSMPWKVFFISTILSVFIAGNMQLFLPIPLPYNIVTIVYDTVIPLTLIILFTDYFKPDKTKKYVMTFLAITTGALLLLNALASSSLIERASINPEMSQALEWIQSHNTIHDVYFADSSIQEEILLWTPVRLYYCDSYKTIISYDELTQRAIEGQRLLVKDTESILKEVHKITSSRSYPKSNFWGKLISSPMFGAVQNEEFTQFFEKRKESETKYMSMNTTRSTYKLDYM